ncbi:class I glutamine amidotransferase-like protein [Zychaea mexicana]|uniref:class I glutamine amidotransferase-like protein n=1 Tax=Zychaea mexicana TaxID=64656 RepID=UPI0022FE9FD7|nr:class I glutamine amidotransferase-like protein [Zychaea mexicana]KAI9495504.1 class I glutamine amidotransferase-like protein [Zychaea mexicana]
MTRKLKLALLVCDTPRPEVREEHGDYPRMFSDVFSRANRNNDVEITWQFFDAVHKQEYPDLRDLAENRTFDGIVITGSSASAHTDEPWILELVQFVHKMRAEPFRSQVKLVGVCFGHQIIARACGGSCEKNPNGWERMNQVHQDHVKTLPPGFHSLATTAPHTPIHSLLSDDNQCITVQGHPEFVRQVVRILLTLRRDAGIVPKEYADEQLAKMEKAPTNDDDDEWMVSKFIDFVLGDLPAVPKDHVDLETGKPFGANVHIGND